MKNSPKISVLLAVYNGERFLREAIQSVLDQTYENFELLIGLNGCVDSSKKIAESYDDGRIVIFDYGDDAGKAKTLNKMIHKAAGEWLAIQDHDDVWLPKKLQMQMKYVEDYDVIGTNTFYINEKGVPTGGPNLSVEHEEIIERSMNGDNQIINTSAIFKTKDTIEVNGWDTNIDGIEDYDFWLKLMKKGCSFINVAKQLVLHRVHDGSNFNTQKFDIESLIKKYK